MPFKIWGRKKNQGREEAQDDQVVVIDRPIDQLPKEPDPKDPRDGE